MAALQNSLEEQSLPPSICQLSLATLARGHEFVMSTYGTFRLISFIVLYHLSFGTTTQTAFMSNIFA